MPQGGIRGPIRHPNTRRPSGHDPGRSGNRRQSRRDALLDEVEQAVAIFQTDDLDEHDESADDREMLSVDVDRGSSRLGAAGSLFGCGGS